MPRYDRSDIKPGALIELDCGEPVHLSTPRHVRYGDAPDPSNLPDFSAISERLDAARERLEKIVKDYRARGRR